MKPTAEPITDADVPCPTCQGRAWDLVTRSDPGPRRSEQAIICRRCGYEALGYFGAPPEIPTELEEPLQKAGEVVGRFARFAAGKWQDFALQVDFSVYGLDPAWTGSRSVAGFTTTGLGRAYSVELLHGEIELASPSVVVETTREEDGRSAAEDVVGDVLEDGLETLDTYIDEHSLPASMSEPARQLTVHLRELEAERELEARVEGAKRETTTIRVDAKPVEFVVAEAEGLVAAAGVVGELDISVLAHGVSIDQFQLHKVELSDYRRDVGTAGG